MPQTHAGHKRKRNDDNERNVRQPKAKKQKQAIGYCSASISKCKSHGDYLCKPCHPTSNGLLTKPPKYLPGTEKPCTWKNYPKKSIPKHSKRYHGTKSQHSQHWVENPSAKQSLIACKPHNNNNSNNHNNSSNASNSSNRTNTTIQNIFSNDVIAISEEHVQNILSYTPSQFVLSLDHEVTLIHVSPTRKKKQTTLNDYQFTDNPPKTLDECESNEAFKLDDIHFNKNGWSTMRKDGNKFEFGCAICPKFDNKNQTVYARETYPLQCLDSDFLNRTEHWKYVYNTHSIHESRAGHKYAVGRAMKSNYANDKALKNQIESYLHILRHHEPDIAYPRNLYLIHRTGLKQIKEQQFVLRGCKTDKRAAKGCKAFRTIEERSAETAIPYD
eukprot:200141_1